MTFETWLLFTAASAVLVAIPGPTVLLVVGCALRHGRAGARAAAPGVALGDLAAMSASMLGAGAALAASATLFTAVKLAGAAFLAWLGLRMILGARDRPLEATAAAAPPRRRVFRQAFLVTLLNPKSLLFFVAFAPQFIDPAAAYAPQAAILVATFTALGWLNALLWGLAFGEVRAIAARPGVLTWVERAGGGCLLGAGAWTAAAAR